MSISLTELWVILGCGAITVLSRVLPFAFVKSLNMPDWLISFLSFVPITIMTALCCESLFVAHAGHLATLNVANCLAAIPATLAGILTKSLLMVVVVGIMAMAVLRYFAIGG
ncbi:MAG: AzlD domain-containing protein [Levilactobacillus sp.]|jgi:branched-subunit amino acid transport protein|uniref:AzlD domain-containing protein n=1 Tax=Levilactobacillus suantsaiihabitans TaxID=2487722 RepID=A0A4Z0JBD0_9LACO|nr:MULTISPECIES: AzlD domain-containing protein [Levilactobacillus]MCH4123754.1 AzlD domain-containing protein [Levilactobacillus sp.]MCI1553852.1 AzlD domain-containing protein [Levilactobacillus sp.]MCI1599206.1 AzlD domain-containing protein [Levilactobacillus sp.]MCI1606243.1 AzlD domain-containing protein [Levilactobacillus sp.]TGD19421.1 AzlD domain-containing protein [Levilactobacillus suantsaiihabitans]